MSVISCGIGLVFLGVAVGIATAATCPEHWCRESCEGVGLTVGDDYTCADAAQTCCLPVCKYGCIPKTSTGCGDWKTKVGLDWTMEVDYYCDSGSTSPLDDEICCVTDCPGECKGSCSVPADNSPALEYPDHAYGCMNGEVCCIPACGQLKKEGGLCMSIEDCSLKFHGRDYGKIMSDRSCGTTNYCCHMHCLIAGGRCTKLTCTSHECTSPCSGGLVKSSKYFCDNDDEICCIEPDCLNIEGICTPQTCTEEPCTSPCSDLNAGLLETDKYFCDDEDDVCCIEQGSDE